MNQEYLRVPLTLAKGSLSKISLRESIYQFIALIIASRMGSLPFDPAFGCHIWDAEYTYLSAKDKGDIRSNIREAINSYEGRLRNVSVDVRKSIVDRRKNKACLVATVKGEFIEEGEKRSFSENYFLWQPRREGLI